MNPFDGYLRAWSARVVTALENALPRESERPEVVHRAMRYTVLAGGKRVRPVLCLLSARAAGGEEEEAMPAAVAVEMVHAFSLIHDDLPVMDDDDFRRGKPSCHRVFGEAVAVLAGDGLLNLAFGVLARLPREEVVPRAVRVLAEAVGTAGLIGGQVEDIGAEGEPPDLETVERIHLGKTAALFRGCARLGVVAADGDETSFESLSRFAELIGLAFQIVDDVLDETGGDDELGKTTGKDSADRKMTYPAAIGIEASIARARALAAEARDAVAGMPEAGVLAGLADRVVERTH